MGFLAARPPKVDKLAGRGDVPGLIAALAHTDERGDGGAGVRARAATALTGFEEERVSEALVQALADPVRPVRDAAIAALVAQGPSRAVAPMCAAATLWTAPEQAPARGEAVAALEAMHDPRACARVAKSMLVRPAELDESDRAVIARLAASAPACHMRIVEEMIAVLGDAEGGLRAATMLVWLAPESVEPLLAALGEAGKREQAALALGQIHATEAVEPLCGLLLESSESAVRRTAAWALGEIRDVSGVEALVLATGDGDYEVRTEAGRAFDRFGNVGLTIALTAMVPRAGLEAGAEHELVEVEQLEAEAEAGAEAEAEAGAEAPTAAAEAPEADAGATAVAGTGAGSDDAAPRAADAETTRVHERPAVAQPTAVSRTIAAPEPPATPSQAVVPALRRLLKRRGLL